MRTIDRAQMDFIGRSSHSMQRMEIRSMTRFIRLTNALEMYIYVCLSSMPLCWHFFGSMLPTCECRRQRERLHQQVVFVWIFTRYTDSDSVSHVNSFPKESIERSATHVHIFAIILYIRATVIVFSRSHSSDTDLIVLPDTNSRISLQMPQVNFAHSESVRLQTKNGRKCCEAKVIKSNILWRFEWASDELAIFRIQVIVCVHFVFN